MNKAKVLVSGIVLTGLAGIGGYYLNKARTSSKTGVVHHDGMEIFKAAQLNAGMQLKTHMDSPVGIAWKANDFAKLSSMFGLQKSVAENASFFQASIYVLDVTKMDWKPDEKKALQELQSSIAEYIMAKRERPALGPEAQALSYASKVLLKFDSLPEAVVKKMSDYYSVATSEGLRNQRDIVGETLMRISPLPEKGLKIIREKLRSKNDPYQGIVLIGQMRDAQAAAGLWNEVAVGFESFPSRFQPMIFKQLVIRHSIIKSDISGHLHQLLKYSGQVEEADDAFLVGVRELNMTDKYRSEIQRISNQTRYAATKTLAVSLLNSSGGAK
ncbi:hypothetical protein [Bdellovibrio sp. GT3]|uniref:hypothetical protein n=1 Tax=Bdellovibrio sp. GT3 TaxID=3136282 RepID=UPI0030F2022E